MKRTSFFREMFRSLGNRRRVGKQTPRLSPVSAQMECLESRTLLTGNITASIAAQSLYVFGDEAGNSIVLARSGNNVVLRGLDGTTINGQSADFLVREGSTEVGRYLFAYLNGGNDTFALGAGVAVRKDAFVYLGEGNDTFAMHGSRISKGLTVDLGNGTDSVSLLNAFVSRDVVITGGVGDKNLSFESTVLGNHVTILTSTGADNIVFDRCVIEDDTYIATSLGDDNIVITGSGIVGNLTVDTSTGDDFVQIEAASHLVFTTSVYLGQGDDNLIVEDGGAAATGNRISGPFFAFGQSGNDAIETGTFNSFERGRNVFDADRSTVDNALQADQLNNATTGALTRANLLQQTVNTLIVPPALTVSVATTVVENATAAVTGTVTRPTGSVGALLVTLASSDTSEVTVPASVTIPAGQASATFNITAVNDAIADGTQTATITATSLGFTNGTDTIDVTDEDGPPALTVTLNPATIGEGGGATASTATVARNTVTTDALTVTLASSLTAAATVPATVTILAGQASVTFAIAAVEDTVNNGISRPVTVTATATGLANGTATLTVNDNDLPLLALTIVAASIGEAGGASATTGTVSRPADLTTGALVVTLASNDTSEATVPATATIADGQTTSAPFNIAAVNDAFSDGTKNVTVTASATGFNSATDTVNVTDNEGPAALTVSVSPTSVAETAGAAASTGTVTRNSDPAAALVVTLTSSGATLVTVPATVTILAGQTSATFAIATVNNATSDGTQVVTVTAGATNFMSGGGDLTITDDELLLTLTTTGNTLAESNGTLVTKQSTFAIGGTTVAGATVALDTDGDGFDDGTTTATGTGTFTLTAPLTNTTTNRGLNSLRVRSSTVAAPAGTIEELEVHRAVGSVVQFTTNVGSFAIEMLDTDAPLTVQNFKSYLADYTNSVVHRSPPDFVIQGGGFTVNAGVIADVAKKTPVANEFFAANGNVRGTLSMALPGGVAGQSQGTSEWFISTVDNSFLDANRHTVFGRVIEGGMDIVDTINALSISNLNVQLSEGAFGQTPLLGNLPFENLAGTVSVNAGTTAVTGVGTSFLSALEARNGGVAGTTIQIGSETFTVQSITSNTQLTLSSAASATSTGVVAQRQAAPLQSNYIVFSSIAEILA